MIQNIYLPANFNYSFFFKSKQKMIYFQSGSSLLRTAVFAFYFNDFVKFLHTVHTSLCVFFDSSLPKHACISGGHGTVQDKGRLGSFGLCVGG